MSTLPPPPPLLPLLAPRGGKEREREDLLSGEGGGRICSTMGGERKSISHARIPRKKVGKREIFGVKIAPLFCSNACFVARHFKSVHFGLI